jgi:hypothetical protein
VVNAHQREIGVGVVADHAGDQIAAVRRHDHDTRGSLHHMTIGEDQPIGRYDDAGPAACLARIAFGAHVDAHDGGTDPLDDVDHGARIGVEQGGVAARCDVVDRFQFALVEHGDSGALGGRRE